MLKFKVTNVSPAPKFLIEAGRLLQPGDSVPVNRLDKSTRDDPAFSIVEGQFEAVKWSPTGAKPVKHTAKLESEDEDDFDKPVKRPAAEDGPATLKEVKPVRLMKVVPLDAVSRNPGSTKANGSQAEDQLEGAGKTAEDDELDGLVAKAERPAKDDQTSGFTTRPGLRSEGGESRIRAGGGGLAR